MITPELSIVVAVYNEDPRNLLRLLERLWTVISELNIKYEVVFVNDGSGIETTKALRQIADEVNYVKLIELSRNFGQQAAISAGMDHADGKAIVNIDSDLQDPPELIPAMVQYWKEGYDVVYAQRSTRRDRFSKRFSAYLFYRLLSAISQVRIPWDTGDFRLIDRKVAIELKALPETTRFLRGHVPWLGFRQIGIPIDRGAREVGETTYTVRKMLSLAMDGILGFSVAPLFLIPVVGVLIAVVALAFGGFALIQPGRLQVDNLAVLAGIGVFAGIQIMCIGLMAVYMSKIMEEVRGRPTYVVGNRLGLGYRNSSSTREAAHSSNGSVATLVR